MSKNSEEPLYNREQAIVMDLLENASFKESGCVYIIILLL